MTKGVNKVILVGHVGNDPEVRYTPAGFAVAKLSLATSESWKDKQTGEKQERTEWHRVVFFGKLAEVVGEWVKKGTLLYIEGSLKTTKYQDKISGLDRYSTDINATNMQMLSNKEGQAGTGSKGASTAQHTDAPIDETDSFEIPF